MTNLRKAVTVELEYVQQDEFDLPLAQHVAKYEGEDIATEWNKKNRRSLNRRPNVFKRAFNSMRRGIWGTTAWFVLGYIFLYYLVNILIIQWYCARDYAAQHTQANVAQQLMIDANKKCADRPSDFDELSQKHKNTTKLLDHKHSICLDYDLHFMALAKQEPNFTRLLTFLIGFYVSFTLTQWWSQVTSIPTIDFLSMTLEGQMSCTGDKKEDDVFIKEGVTVTHFKQTVSRYCLLSWAMCMSMVSAPLRNKLFGPQDFNLKHLLTYEEYMQLKTSNGKTEEDNEAWKKKWAIPMLWANSMVSDAHTRSLSSKGFVFKEFKEVLKATQDYQDRLEKVYEKNKNKVPDLLTQAILLGIYFWFFFGIFAAQGLVNKESNNTPMYVALILNFPMLQIIKYVVMMGWLQAAFGLQQPFGYDE